MKQINNHINYVEYKATNLELVKAFYTKAFNWEFTDYGPTYIAFDESGLQGGFELTEDQPVNGALVVLYHSNLESSLDDVKNAGGTITKYTFSFPGGRRFQFLDPSGNELAVWSDK
jgi:predicted enzyme related to lactoylglutathione lyase